jgi:transcriptional regulator with XRE-family HTH domain
VKKIGENIRFYRNLRGLTQTALAKQVEVAPAYISQIEANQRVPSLKVTRRIASVLGIEASILVRETDPRVQQGRLSDSEKLDLLRTLILAVEGESRESRASSETPSLEAREFVGTELYSEPAFCLVLREFTGAGIFGRESSEVDVESHTVLEGRVRVVGGAAAGELAVGDCRSLVGGDGEVLAGSRGARVLSVYAPRVTLQMLAEASERQAAAAGSRARP